MIIMQTIQDLMYSNELARLKGNKYLTKEIVSKNRLFLEWNTMNDRLKDLDRTDSLNRYKNKKLLYIYNQTHTHIIEHSHAHQTKSKTMQATSKQLS